MNKNFAKFHWIHTTYTYGCDKENTIQVPSQNTFGSHISNGRSIMVYIDTTICCTFSYIMCYLSTTWIFLMIVEYLNWLKWAPDCLQRAGQRSPPYKSICLHIWSNVISWNVLSYPVFLFMRLTKDHSATPWSYFSLCPSFSLSPDKCVPRT